MADIRSIRDRAEAEAAEAESTEEPEGLESPPPIPPLEGDSQLTLNLGSLARGPIEAEVSLMSASIPLEGILAPNTEQLLEVSVVPQSYRYVPVRENGKVVRWKLRIQARPTYVRRVAAEAAEAG